MADVRRLVARKVAEREKSGALVPERSDNRMEAISNAVLTLTSRQEYAAEIRIKWSEAREKFLTVGRYLVRAKATLPHGEFEQMVERDLPFSVETAYHLRCVAEAVDGGRLQPPELPGSYSVAYQLVTLDDAELGLARERGLVRPDVSRADIVRFKRTIRTASRGGGGDRLVAEYRRLKARLRELEEALRHRGIDPATLGADGPEIDLVGERLG